MKSLILCLLCSSYALAQWEFTHGADFMLQSSNLVQHRPFVLDTADTYAGNWLAFSVPVEVARDWERRSTLAQYTFTAQRDSVFYLQFELPLRRDLESWYRDKWGLNVPTGPTHLDINAPYIGYMQLKQSWWHIQFGRFDYNIGDSEQSNILSASPWEDAFLAELTSSNLHYRLYIASLLPVLHGTPDRDGSLPVGSEAYIQANRSISNARKRYYNAPVKTLALHSLALRQGFLSTELGGMAVIGGKYPDLKDILPFGLYHNEYRPYNNMGGYVQLRYKDTTHLAFLQLVSDEISNPIGQDAESSQFSWHFGAQRRFIGPSLEFKILIEQVYQTAYFGNYETPLGKMTSRKRYTSNYRDQFKPYYADMYMVDYPLGYWRGSDVHDWWLTMTMLAHGWEGKWIAGYLQKGEHNLMDAFDPVSSIASPSGVVEKQWQVHTSHSYAWPNGLQIHGGILWSHFWNYAHSVNEQKTIWGWELGFRFSL
jgi:hypothetical protein